MIRWLGLSILLLLSAHTSAWAHVQAGPPYLQVNSEYADTTPIISSGLIVVPQDVTKTNILVGTDVTFRVDLTRLTVPAEVAQASKWRWKFDLGDSNWTEGVTVTHRYDKTGSYLVSLQVKDPTTPNFIDYDLVQVNVVPKLDYALPSARVTATISRDTGIQDVTFTATGSVDPSTSVASYSWDFGDGSQGQGDSVLHSYSKNISAYYPLVRVTDQNSLLNDYVLEITADDKVSVVGSSYVSTTSAKPKSSGDLPLLLIALVILAVGLVVTFLKFFRK